LGTTMVMVTPVWVLAFALAGTAAANMASKTQ
jgi:hypothetical protein